MALSMQNFIRLVDYKYVIIYLKKCMEIESHTITWLLVLLYGWHHAQVGQPTLKKQ